MSKKSNHTDDEIAQFHQAMQGVKPLRARPAKIRLNTRPILKRSKEKHQLDEEPLILNEKLDLNMVGGEAIISYKQAAVPNKTLRKLRKGQYNVEAILDLHGMTVDKAKANVERFLQDCLRKTIRVALIIHGKGQHSASPILKNKLNHWLRDTAIVLAFSSASATHGSRGAIYVLLKRNAEETWIE